MNQQKYNVSIYQVFPGIRFIYTDAHVQSISAEEHVPDGGRNIEISHCREGRAECSNGKEFWYLGPGDLAVVKNGNMSSVSRFPLGHYHGLTIRINLDQAPKCLSCFLDDVKVQPEVIAEKFCSVSSSFVARANPAFEHIFSELYSVPEEIRKGYFKIKTLELLLFLSALEVKPHNQQGRIYTGTQVEFARSVSQYLLDNMSSKVTLENLSKKFHISGTQLKTIFKGVYGVPLGAYVRTQKMESAAYMLEYTDKPILEIAGEHGYDNGSKFASAFKSVKGVNPAEYRMANSAMPDKNKLIGASDRLIGAEKTSDLA